MKKKKKMKLDMKRKNIISEMKMVSLIKKWLERLIDLKNRGINDELVGKCFQIQDLWALLKKLKKSQKTIQEEITFR